MIAIVLATLLASPSPAPIATRAPITASTPVFERIGRIDLAGIFGRRDNHCADRGAQKLMGAAQVVDSLVAGNAIRHGSIGVRLFGSASPLGFIAETLITDIILHRVERHASCGIRTATDVLLMDAAINNAAQTGFPR